MAAITRASVNNPQLLRWARITAGYEVEEMAEYLGKTPEDLIAWEEGEAEPTYRQLQKFAKKVGRAVATLYLPEVPEEPGPPEDYRFLPGAERNRFSPQALLAFREMRTALSSLRSLAEASGMSAEFALPQWSGLANATDRASELRETLGISVSEQIKWSNAYRALDEWRWTLFGRGVLVQVFRMPIEDVRGFSLIDSDLGGIGLNSQDAAAGRVFSTFHEVAHLCVGRPGVSGEGPISNQTTDEVRATERFCDRFAAAFLFPPGASEVEKAMEELAADFSTEAAIRIGRRFSVSRDVVARRISEMGLVSADDYWNMVEEWRRDRRRRPGGRRGGDYVTTTVSHKGKPFVAKVLEAVDAGTVSRFEASQILSLRPGNLDEARNRVLAT